MLSDISRYKFENTERPFVGIVEQLTIRQYITLGGPIIRRYIYLDVTSNH
jgi:hypothetical protein